MPTTTTTTQGVRPDSRRWDQLVAGGRKRLEHVSDAAWYLGDAAMEIVPMGADRANNGALDYLRRYADELDVEYNTLIAYRTVSSAWPKDIRVAGTSWTVHQVLQGARHRALIRPGMTKRQAIEARDRANAAAAPPPAPITAQEREQDREANAVVLHLIPGGLGNTEVLMAFPACMIDGPNVPAENLVNTDMGRAYLCHKHTEEYGHREEETSPLMLWARTQPELTVRAARRYVASVQSWAAVAAGLFDGAHEYVRLADCPDPAMQMKVLQFIRIKGELRERPSKKRYHYWAAGDGYEYWALAETETILNRARLETPQAATEE